MRYIDWVHKQHRDHYKLRKQRKRTSEELEYLVTHLYDEIRTGIPVLVEGINDVRAMERSFGPGNYLRIYRKNVPLRALLLESVENFGNRQIILTDLDKKGNKLAKKISDILSELGAIGVLKYRRILSLMNISFVEALSSKAEDIRLMLHILDINLSPWPEQ